MEDPEDIGEYDPRLIAIKEHLDKKGHFTFLRTWAPGQSVFFAQTGMEDGNTLQISERHGYVFSRNQILYIWLIGESREIECTDYEQVLNCLSLYFE